MNYMKTCNWNRTKLSINIKFCKIIQIRSHSVTSHCQTSGNFERKQEEWARLTEPNVAIRYSVRRPLRMRCIFLVTTTSSSMVFSSAALKLIAGTDSPVVMLICIPSFQYRPNSPPLELNSVFVCDSFSIFHWRCMVTVFRFERVIITGRNCRGLFNLFSGSFIPSSAPSASSRADAKYRFQVRHLK